MDSDKIIIEPIVTEKTNLMREKNKYTFRVDSKANKFQVMKSVRELFNVHPVKCSIINVHKKPKKVRYKLGYTSEWKKAIVTLPPDEVIQVFKGA